MNLTMDTDTMQIVSKQGSRISDMKKLGGGGPRMSAEKADAAAQEFEAQFISQMLENMFSTVDTNPVLGGGEGEDAYKSMLVDEYGKLLARSGGIGVADHVKRELLRVQESESML